MQTQDTNNTNNTTNDHTKNHYSPNLQFGPQK